MRNAVASLGLALLSAPALLSAQAGPPADLPLQLLPASTAGPMLAVFMTGDGDWAELDRDVAGALVQHGVAVVGFESHSYLAHGAHKSPDTIGLDLERILQYYLKAWGRSTVLVIGYSRGAQLAPFAVSRLSADLRRHVRLIALLNPALSANFTYHFADLLGDKRRADDVPILPELAKLTGTRVLCVYGVDEKESLCPLIPTGTARIVTTSGGHHFDGDYPALAKLILDESKAP